MSLQAIRNYSLYVGNKKVGVARGHTYTITPNSELQIGDGEVVGVSKGVPTTGLKSDLIIPVAGSKTTLVVACLNQQPVKVALGIVDGKIHKLDMIVSGIEFATEMPNGSLMGTFNFIGGAPKLAG